MRKHVPWGLPGASAVVLSVVAAACSTTQPQGFDNHSTGGSASGSSSGGSGGGSDPGLGGLGPEGLDGGGPDAATGPIDTTPPCDTGLAVDDSDAASFAKAIGICTTAAAAGYGLVSATYSNAFGSTAPPHAGQWGLLPKFGNTIVPREGSAIGALSSGYAREYDDLDDSSTDPNADFVDSAGGPLDGTNYPTGAAPPGYPQAAAGCQQDNLVNDMIDVKLVLKAPPNATGFEFDFDFYSSEWPDFVCSNFNDAFNAYVTSQEKTGNVSFDSNGNPIAVNVDFFDRCTPNTPVGCLSSDTTDPNTGALTPNAPISTSTCSAGVAELQRTGFGDTSTTGCSSGNVTATVGGATGWLTTQAAISGGEQFTLEFMIWDAGDGWLDSVVLIDHFQWIGGMPVTPITVRPPP